jgi:Protein of unknown function (DUF1524)
VFLQDFKAKLNSRLPDKTPFKAGFSALHYSQSDSRDRPLIRYILAKIDASLRKDAAIDYSKMTIEHIAPQNPPDQKFPQKLHFPRTFPLGTSAGYVSALLQEYAKAYLSNGEAFGPYCFVIDDCIDPRSARCCARCCAYSR